MAYSYVDLVASAGQQNFTFAIPYLSRDNITVFKNGVLLATPANWTFLMAQVVRLTVGATLNDIIRVKRTTPIAEPIVDYSNGSVLGEADLDATALQTLFSAQEVADSQADNIHMNASLQWDALGFPIINLGLPVDVDDAARKGEMDATEAATAASAAAASASASSASSSASAASASASSASSSASSASASAASAALTVANMTGTSTTSLLIAVASKVFTTQAGKFFAAGAWLLITSDANPANYMHGQVTAYSGTSLTVNVTNIGGAGTFADWTIRVSGTRGSLGVAGAQGAQGIQGEPGTGTPGSTVVTETAFGQASTAGSDPALYSRVDHTHGTPTNPVTAHEAAGDPHTQYMTSAEVDTSIGVHAGAADPHTGYQKESEKDLANGYAGLDANGEISRALCVDTAAIAAGAVTGAKIFAAGGNGMLLGTSETTNTPAVFITLGTNLSLAGTTLNASGGGGGASLIHEFW